MFLRSPGGIRHGPHAQLGDDGLLDDQIKTPSITLHWKVDGTFMNGSHVDRVWAGERSRESRCLEARSSYARFDRVLTRGKLVNIRAL